MMALSKPHRVGRGLANGGPATRVWHNALTWPIELPVPLIATEPKPDDRLASSGPFS